MNLSASLAMSFKESTYIVESIGSHTPSVGTLQIVCHTRAVWEQRRSCANFCSHITYGGSSRTWKGIYTRPKVLYDSSSSSLYSQNSCDFQNHIYLEVNDHPISCVPNKPLALVHPFIFPVSRTPITLGHLSSHGISAITSTASAPPTPTATMPRPPDHLNTMK